MSWPVTSRGPTVIKFIRLTIRCLALILVVVLSSLPAQAQDDSAVVMGWQVIAVSVSEASSPDYGISLTGGETAVGAGLSENYGVSGGIVNEPEPSGCCEIRADINHDGVGPDIADLVFMVNYMFNGGPEPPCEEAGYFAEADVNADLIGPDIADLVYLVNYMFSQGPEPVPCPM